MISQRKQVREGSPSGRGEAAAPRCMFVDVAQRHMAATERWYTTSQQRANAGGD